jgi:transposase
MACIQKKEKIKKEINKHPTILKIPDELWDKIKSIFPKEKPLKTVGRPIVPYRKVIDGILYILRTGCQWKMLPKEYGSSSTCHRRFQEWNRIDVFKKGWIRILKICKVAFRGAMTGHNPTDRSKLGTKRHILTDKKRNSAICSYFFSQYT